MAAKIVDLAEAVVTELNAGSFSMAFTATRHYVPKIDLKDAASLSVQVPNAPRTDSRSGVMPPPPQPEGFRGQN